MKVMTALVIFCLLYLAANEYWHDLDTIVVREHVIYSKDTKWNGLNIGLVGDFHFSSKNDLNKIEIVLEQMHNKDIDLIFLVGDYLGDPSILEHISRPVIIERLAKFSSIAPTYAVLGNHDNWDNHDAWAKGIDESIIHWVEGKVLETTIKSALVCIRGLGDFYSDYWRDVIIPPQCEGRTLTLTHDPNGLVQKTPNSVETLSFAGHTHCGQVKLPFLTQFSIPSEAPSELQCGKFMLGFSGVVTGGISTSIIPVRFGKGMEPSWDFVSVSSQVHQR